MWQQEFLWFFTLFHHEFRKNNAIAFEVLMVLAVAHVFGFYNPQQLADFLEVPHQQFYTELKDWSVYHVKKMLLRFMVKQAAEKLKAVMSQSAATRSRAGTTLSIDNSVMDRCGKLLRCTWSWYSGRYHQVIRGQDLLGIVFTIHRIAFPLHVLFCPKQGRYHTTKADLLIFMLTQLKTAFLREGIDITQLPLTMDSAYVSQALRERLHQLGFSQIIIAGKGNYDFTIDDKKQDALTWKKALTLESPKWGIDFPDPLDATTRRRSVHCFADQSVRLSLGAAFASPTCFFQIDHHRDHAQIEARGGFARLPRDAFSCPLFNSLRNLGDIEQSGIISRVR